MDTVSSRFWAALTPLNHHLDYRMLPRGFCVTPARSALDKAALRDILPDPRSPLCLDTDVTNAISRWYTDGYPLSPEARSTCFRCHSHRRLWEYADSVSRLMDGCNLDVNQCKR